MLYCGSKLKLLGFIHHAVSTCKLPAESTFCDLFAGTSVVGRYFKNEGFRVVSNDVLYFNYVLAKAYIELNDYPIFDRLKINLKFKSILDIYKYLNALEPVKSFIYNNYTEDGCKESGSKEIRKYFIGYNGWKIDAVRLKIKEWSDASLINEIEFCYLLSSLLEFVSRAANTAGYFKAFFQDYASRRFDSERRFVISPYNDLVDNGLVNEVENKDALEVVKERSFDIVYMDPPYSEGEYSADYFMLELIAKGWWGRDIEVRGISGKTNDLGERSAWTSKKTVEKALEDTMKNVKTSYLLMSYSNEGLIKEDRIKEILSSRGEVELFTKEHQRYKSHNSSELKTVNEYIFKVGINK